MADVLKNFAYSTVATAPSPAGSGLSLIVAAGDGAKLPAVPFNATVWPSGAQPLTTNATLIRVTDVTVDTLTFTRQAEGSSNRSILVGDQLAATLTAQYVDAGLVNQAPSYDLKIPAWHGLVAAGDYRIGATVDVRVDADGELRVL